MSRAKAQLNRLTATAIENRDFVDFITGDVPSTELPPRLYTMNQVGNLLTGMKLRQNAARLRTARTSLKQRDPSVLAAPVHVSSVRQRTHSNEDRCAPIFGREILCDTGKQDPKW
ncbi:unnamed protein product [Dicrocoelium dendriticum]|nr:unnamed protein product [Dicrocoelium dendriticum]